MSPLDGSLLGTMATVQLPSHFPIDEHNLKEIRSNIYHSYKVEAPLLVWQETAVVRVSSQLYSKTDDITKLLAALSD